MKIGGAAQKLPTYARVRSKTFALVIPQFEDIFASFYAQELLKGVGQSASRLRLDILIHVIDKDRDSPSRLSGESGSLGTVPIFATLDGIVFADIDGNKKLLEWAAARGIPHIVMNNYFENEPVNPALSMTREGLGRKGGVNCIGIDNKVGAREAVEYLLKLGHKHIAALTGNLATQAGRMRLEGYKDALRKAKVPVANWHIAECDFTRTSARKGTQMLLDLRPYPTALFCASDLMAREAIAVIEERKLKVPRDISVIGFDDSPIAREGKLPLTTVAQPLAEMGRLSVEKLNQLILGKSHGVVRELLPAKLVVRDSCSRK